MITLGSTPARRMTASAGKDSSGNGAASSGMGIAIGVSFCGRWPC